MLCPVSLADLTAGRDMIATTLSALAMVSESCVIKRVLESARFF